MAARRPKNSQRGWGRRNLGLLLALVCAAVAGTLARPLLHDGGGESLQSDGRGGASQRPTVNVVLFLIDTLRADRLGTYGYPKATSPHLDSLSLEGVTFEQCNAPAPWTLPSVVSLHTSRLPCQHGVVVDWQRIDASVEPLAARLQRVGYATAGFAANPYAGPMTGLDRGFDYTKLGANTDGALVGDWLDGLDGRPFFLYVHNVEPHNLHNAPDEFIRRFAQLPPDTKDNVREPWLQYKKLTRVDFAAKRPIGTTDNTAQQDQVMGRMAELKDEIDVLYDAAVREADQRVGSVIAALRRRGLWDRTLFIALSDHGEELGDHGGWQHDQSVYEELMRVPLIVRFPGGQFARRRIEEVCSLVDVMPTILHFLGRSDLAKDCVGRNLLPAIRGGTPGDETQLRVTGMRVNRKKYYRPYSETRGDVNLVVRLGSWKGIWNRDVESFELYDLRNDNREQNNLAKQRPELTAALQGYAKRWYETCPTGTDQSAAGIRADRDTASLDGLRALGYIDDDSSKPND